MPRVLCALPLLGLMACADQDGPLPMNDLAGAFFDAPWPSDLRRGASGGPELLHFPNVDTLPLLADYAALAEAANTFRGLLGEGARVERGEGERRKEERVSDFRQAIIQVN
jgi:hypothetical protein